MFDFNNLVIYQNAMLQGTAIACALMVLTWFVARSIKNAGIVDVVWTAAFTFVTLFYAICGSGDVLHRVIIFMMVFVWSMRLTIHLYRRVAAMHPEEDGRYSYLRKEWGKHANRNFFIFFQIQALTVGVLTLPMVMSCANSDSSLKLTEVLGMLIWLTGVIGETVADSQLHQFTQVAANKDKTMMVGLWNYSRHPNYFFEWLVWVGYFFFALSSSGGFFSIYVPLLMLHFLVNVTGVKLNEEHSLRKRGDEYRQYQKTTSAFIPWFKKSTNTQISG